MTRRAITYIAERLDVAGAIAIVIGLAIYAGANVR
jgi:hypothetical protein